MKEAEIKEVEEKIKHISELIKNKYIEKSNTLKVLAWISFSGSFLTYSIYNRVYLDENIRNIVDILTIVVILYPMIYWKINEKDIYIAENIIEEVNQKAYCLIYDINDLLEKYGEVELKVEDKEVYKYIKQHFKKEIKDKRLKLVN